MFTLKKKFLLGLTVLTIGVGTSFAEEPKAELPGAIQGQLLAAKAFRVVADRVKPSLVTIDTFGGVNAGAARRTRGIRNPGEGPTTGLVISEDGIIITSTFNFRTQPPIITVVLNDGSRHVAKLLGRDDTRKLCLLKIEIDRKLAVPKFVDPAGLKVGQWAVTVGVGFGDREPAISAGIVSATNRVSGKAVQTDANISPVNYGGPLLDIDGGVLGICVPLSPSSKEVTSGTDWYDSGIGFAVPVFGLDNVVKAMKDGKTMKPGFLGVAVQRASKDKTGVKVTQVVAGSPASKAGLKKDDLIVALDEHEIIDATHLRATIGRYMAGDKVRVVIERGDKAQELVAELQVPPQKTPKPKPKLKVKPAG